MDKEFKQWRQWRREELRWLNKIQSVKISILNVCYFYMKIFHISQSSQNCLQMSVHWWWILYKQNIDGKNESYYINASSN